MLKDITLGQYYPSGSCIHRLDPRVKLMGTLLFMISLFVNDTYYGYIVITLFYALMVALSRVPFGYIVKGLKPILFIIVFTAALNLFMTDGDVIVRIWKLKITVQGVEKTVFLCIRIILLVLGTTLMTLTTSPNSLTSGLEKGLGFLKYIGVPISAIAMMISIALRFIPILTEEMDKIMKAQTARGADFESGNVFKRIYAMVPLLVPLLISAFRRAGDLAMAMDARCYSDSENRTKLHPLRYRRADLIAYVILAIYMAAVIAIRIIL
ncbi:MAG: energy-coupling factor transporter transmembrane protein EcfT [Lachnospiraceae bacterium]|nr:energy-coupling factor transporter transmembrane protein EcfT [Lachnospiraceae bacterium]